MLRSHLSDSEAGRKMEHEALMVRWYPKSKEQITKEKYKTKEKPEATENKVGTQRTLNKELR